MNILKVICISLAVLSLHLEAMSRHDDFVVFTPPKCGTHLVVKVLELMLEEQGHLELSNLGTPEEVLAIARQAKEDNQFLVAHNFASEKLKKVVDNGYKVIFILRDPRDQLISMQNWMLEGQWGWHKVSKITDKVAQLDELISGTRFGWRCYDGIAKRLKICQEFPGQSYITRFENLVGDEGGGSHTTQIEEIMRIAQFIHLNLTIEQAETIGSQLFGGTSTFRKGQIGQWKGVLLPYQKLTYKRLYGQTLIELGYERDSNW